MESNFIIVYLWLIIYSFVGWVYESALCSVTERRLVNRGFLNGPLCPIYGFGAITIIFCLQSSANDSVIVLFLAGAVLTCTLEYVTSWAMEKLFKTRWWDYSGYRFNINGRVCLLGAIAFGLMSVLLLKLVHPAVAGLVAQIPALWQNIIFGLSLALITADAWVTVRGVISLNNRLQIIQDAINLEKAKGEEQLEKLKAGMKERNLELKELLDEYGFVWTLPLSEQKERLVRKFEASEFYSERINRLMTQRSFIEQRLLKAFPKMQSMGSGDALHSLRSRLRKGKK